MGLLLLISTTDLNNIPADWIQSDTELGGGRIKWAKLIVTHNCWIWRTNAILKKKKKKIKSLSLSWKESKTKRSAGWCWAFKLRPSSDRQHPALLLHVQLPVFALEIPFYSESIKRAQSPSSTTVCQTQAMPCASRRTELCRKAYAMPFGGRKSPANETSHILPINSFISNLRCQHQETSQ